MSLALLPRRDVDLVDRRVIGAFQFVDAVTRFPLTVPAVIEVRRAIMPGTSEEVLLPPRAVGILQNRRGICVITQAPLFETYVSSFDTPQPPPATAAGPLRLRVGVLDAGPHYLPQEFQVDLPRSLDPTAANSVFAAQQVGLFRAPVAPVLDGWAVLRVRVTRTGSSPVAPLPGVVVSVFRSPRGAGDAPIGAGMTDWRGGVAGEALVPVTDVQRFRPGSGPTPIETDQPILFEATRDTGFTGASGQLPDVPRLLAATGEGLIRPPNLPPGSELEILHPTTTPPIRVEAGREYVVQLQMP